MFCLNIANERKGDEKIFGGNDSTFHNAIKICNVWVLMEDVAYTAKETYNCSGTRKTNQFEFFGYPVYVLDSFF